MPPEELPKTYKPAEHEGRVWDRWIQTKSFHADPARVLSGEAHPFCVLIPPPNVTAALHLGHGLNNTLQDIVVRAKRMQGFETLWMPGTDHAGIATQAVVEKRVMKEEKKRRTDFVGEAGRAEFISKIQAFKDEYEATITGQLQKMGCSCDWDRQRFTMDEVCAAAVREAFFRLFKDGLIYRGKRLVNWDPALQTAVADDECYDEEVDTSFWYLRYPIVRGRHHVTEAASHHVTDVAPVTWGELVTLGYPGAESMPGDEPACVTVATTRPETYMGDTGVAINPHDPRAGALRGLSVRLPLVGRVIPIIEDSYVVLPKGMARTEEEANDPKAEFATGFLKVTPAHDPNDYEIGQRHTLAMISMMSPDGRVSDKHGWTDVGDAHLFVGKTMAEARKLVVKEFEARGLLESIRPYRHSVKHSDRSKAVIEPYLSDQWYVKVTDPRLAGAANAALVQEQRTSEPFALGGTALQSGALHRLPAGPLPTHRPKFDSIRRAGFVGHNPYPPGQPSPDFLRTIRNLPHVLIDGATYFVTWRLREGELSPAERLMVLDALQHGHDESVTLFAAVVMPDHVHAVVKPLGASLPEWVASVKKFSARRVNDARTTSGNLWQDERFDHIIRDEVWFETFARYVINNPAEAGLVVSGQQYAAGAVHWSVIEAFGLSAPQSTALESGATKSTGQRRTALESGATKVRATGEDTSDGSLRFFPARYAKTYESWHDNIRDWCISRQLWWGHRIPVWSGPTHSAPRSLGADVHMQTNGDVTFVCLRASTGNATAIATLESHGFTQDPDVLDTWFSSALWPMSTMGWPDPEAAASKTHDPSMAMLLEAFNPTTTLCTAREIITLWVSRMVMFNRYFMGEGQGKGPPPFRDVVIHAVVQDGEGRKMSKSLGNGVDPLDIIESHGADAMRFTVCKMSTQTQDVRLPVTRDPVTKTNTSPKFDEGRNFCNKLWNAARFAMAQLGPGEPGSPHASPDGSMQTASTPAEYTPNSLIDRWMLSRVASSIDAINAHLDNYQYSEYAQAIYDLLWRDFCDWYLEGIKPSVAGDPAQQAVLRATLDAIVRVLHPIAPFVTEAIFEHVSKIHRPPVRGLSLTQPRKGTLCTAGWPVADPHLLDPDAEATFDRARALVTAIREVRASLNVPPKKKGVLHAPAELREFAADFDGLIESLAGLDSIQPEVPAGGPRPAGSTGVRFEGFELILAGIVEQLDGGAERARLQKLIADLDKSIATLTGRLSNPGYTDRAPPQMVQQTRDQLTKAQEERAAAATALAALAGSA